MFILIQSGQKVVNLGAAISAEWVDGKREALLIVFPGADTDDEGIVLPLVEVLRDEAAQRAWEWYMASPDLLI